MLIKHEVLRRIVAGEIDTLYRCWKRPTVKAGGSLRTRVGVLAIDSVEPVAKRALRAADARRAGFASRAALIDALSSRDGTVYRIRVRHAGEDPRVALRETPIASAAEAADVEARLHAIDRRSQTGPWTHTYLRLIADHPGVRAIELAESLGLEKRPFKQRVRKLKELGLTVSLSPGYRLSPRGQSLLEWLER